MKLTSQTKNYANLLKEIKTRITQAQYEALKTVNKFKGALNVIKSFRERGILSESNDKIYEALLKAIAQKIVRNRPSRQEPRVVKRRPKAFPRMQKSHYSYRKKEAD